MLLNNLIFNAISNSPENTTVNITAELVDGYCSIEIYNEMLEPLSAADMDMLFKRFWRKDSARESGRHAGIGLSLVKSYVECMKIEVKASIKNDGRFAIRLAKIKTI
ncbi:MAG: signal transduction histidine kinase [Planctomycetota bacterium]|jgi:signal transduction histidine kinase